jgi:chitin disaccharide deacetylase
VVFPDHCSWSPAGWGAAAPSSGPCSTSGRGHRGVRHPAADNPELRALAPDWPNRVDDHHLLCHDADLRAMIRRAGVRLIGYRELRDLQRAG